MTTGLSPIKRDPGTSAVEVVSPHAEQLSLIERMARDPAIDPSKLEKFLDMQERVAASRARERYCEAMARFSAEVKPIPKKRVVRDRNGKQMYTFANREDIERAIKPVEVACGFSHRFDTKPADGGVFVTCVVSHVGAHSESSSVFISKTKGMNTNAAQDNAIEVQYGCRIALSNAYGLSTTDEDVDAARGLEGRAPKIASPSRVAEVRDIIASAKRDEGKVCDWLKVATLDDATADQIESVAAMLAKKG